MAGMISKVKFATVYVSDRERSLAFYRDKLGFKVTTGVSFSARGVEYANKPKQESWGWSSMFKDPDGTVFMLGSDT